MPPDAPGGFPPPQGPPQQPPPPRPQGPPEYKVYRSRRGLLDRLRGDRPAGESPLRRLRRRRRGDRPPGVPGAPRPGKPLWRRVLRYALIGAAAWLLLSFVVFMVSAQTQEGVSNRTEDALSSGGSLLTGSTILVLGSDQRPKGTKEPGARGAPSRADSIMLLRVGLGSVRKLSILRDSFANIPGNGQGRINAAYAFGGAALQIETVEEFMGNGLEINHVIEVDFSNFPELIDALGGVDITLDNCLKSDRFGDKRVKLSKGDHHLSGREALRFARVRKNKCAPNEDDRARARRQQQVLKGMRDRLVHPKNWPSTFVRAPWIAWEAPRALRTDMKGPGLLALFTDLLTGGSGETRVLEFDGVNGDGSLRVTREARAEAVEDLVEG
ncbi:MAG TPA: LCP family protein [Thermoleophilaceae bacterium]|nr:LCP family protein [Thermoleophilaceae bacterium]